MSSAMNRTVNVLGFDTLKISPQQLGVELRQSTGLALRRTGALTALAWLAARRCHAQASPLERPKSLENPATDRPATLLLWHSALLVAEENRPLLQTLWFDHEGVMPFQFLSTQPALVGLALRAHMPELVDAQYLPWPDDHGTLIWPRCLQLAAHALASGRAARVICMHLEHTEEGLSAQTLSLALNSPASGQDRAALHIQLPSHDLAARATPLHAHEVYAALQALTSKPRTNPEEAHRLAAESLTQLGLSIKSAL
jgi:hypothetical protein